MWIPDKSGTHICKANFHWELQLLTVNPWLLFHEYIHIYLNYTTRNRQGHSQNQAYLCHDFPVVKDSLGEGLARGGSTQCGGESKGLNDRQVRLQVEDGSSYKCHSVEFSHRPSNKADWGTVDSC